MSSHNITIEPATSSDIPALAAIFAAAWPPDQVSKMKNGGVVDTDESRKAMIQPALEGWSENKKCFLLKAVDQDVGAIVGWICWAKYQPEKRPNDVLGQLLNTLFSAQL